MANLTTLPITTSKVIPIALNVRTIDAKQLTPIPTNRQFFTTDTDAWLQIAVGDLDLTGTVTNLTLLNISEGDGGSVISRDITVQSLNNQNYFFYEMSQIITTDGVTDSPILHAGDWIGQIYVTKDGNHITSCRFKFSVKGHLLDGRTAALIAVDDIVAFKGKLTILNDLLTAFQVDVSEIEAAELLRIALYEEVSTKLANGELIGPAGPQGPSGLVGELYSTDIVDFGTAVNDLVDTALTAALGASY